MCSFFISGNSYFFYESENGVEHPDIHQVRLKRDATDTKTDATSSNSTSAGSSSTIAAPTTTVSPKTPESPVSDVSKEDSKSRGWMAPENETMVVKEINENMIDVPDEKINATLKQHIKDEGLNDKEVSNHLFSWWLTFILGEKKILSKKCLCTDLRDKTLEKNSVPNFIV